MSNEVKLNVSDELRKLLSKNKNKKYKCKYYKNK